MTDTNTPDEQAVIGRAERILFVGVTTKQVPAKIDTGADLSSVWASDIVEKDDSLSFQLFAPGSKYYTGNRIVLKRDEYRRTGVANSFGVKESRYVVKLLITVKGRTIRASFTLADRSKKVYPVLLGRKLMHNKFIVDVSRGEPLSAKEVALHRKLILESKKQES